MERVNRRWGFYEVLSEQPGYLVKKLVINPTKSISLQYHNHRSEHWVILSGTGVVKIDLFTFNAETGNNFAIKVGDIHKITNTGSEELILIEVQVGKILSENDIIRLEEIDETGL